MPWLSNRNDGLKSPRLGESSRLCVMALQTFITQSAKTYYRPELMLPRQESCIERVSRVADVVVWGGESHNICVSDP